MALATALAHELPFFHWPLEFPDVFAARGFDVVLCNPPWERIKLQEQEFFAARDPQIAAAPHKAARGRLIQALPPTNPALWEEFRQAKHLAEALSKFLRASNRFPLTARGDINTYAVFAELFTQLIGPRGRVGVLLPTGIATDDTNKGFFGAVVQDGRLASLYDFENREKIFPAVDSRYKFSLLTLRGAPPPRPEPIPMVFFATRAEHLRDERRRFALTPSDLALLNPNTRTCPIFRTRQDAELTRRIYERVPVLVNEGRGENPWGVSFLRMFDMANDSHLFRTRPELEKMGFCLQGNRFVRGADTWLPLYEAKMIWHFDHRWATYEGADTRDCTDVEKCDPQFEAHPRYWVAAREIDTRLSAWKRAWLIGFRDIARATDERTAIFSLLPRVGVGHKIPLVMTSISRHPTIHSACLLGNLNCLVLDYMARHKVGGLSLSYFILKQLPIFPPDIYSPTYLSCIVPRVLELVYTAWDLRPFAEDVWQEADEPLRAALRAQWEGNAAATGGGHHGAESPPWAPGAKGGFPLPPLQVGRGPPGRPAGRVGRPLRPPLRPERGRAALHPRPGRCPRAGLSGGDVPGAEGEGDQAVWGVQDQAVGVGGMGTTRIMTRIHEV